MSFGLCHRKSFGWFKLSQKERMASLAGKKRNGWKWSRKNVFRITGYYCPCTWHMIRNNDVVKKEGYLSSCCRLFSRSPSCWKRKRKRSRREEGTKLWRFYIAFPPFQVEWRFLSYLIDIAYGRVKMHGCVITRKSFRQILNPVRRYDITSNKKGE